MSEATTMSPAAAQSGSPPSSETAAAGEQSSVFTPAAELDDLFWKLQRSKVKLLGPAPNTRASSIGHPCDRYTFYERTLPAEKRTSYSPELQSIFDLGNELERYAFRKLEEMGVDIVQRGRDYSDPKYQLSGTVDARLKLPHWKRSLPTEVKGLNEHSAGSIKTLDDIREHHQAWIRKYYSQLQTYLFLGGDDLGLFALFNKSAGTFRFIACPIDYDHAEKLLKKAERIKLAVVRNKIPDRNTSSECNRCQFVAVCGPDIQFGPGVDVVEDPDLESKIARREELSPLAREFHALDNEIKDRLPEKEGTVLVGDFALTRKEIVKRPELRPRAGYTYYRTDIRKLK